LGIDRVGSGGVPPEAPVAEQGTGRSSATRAEAPQFDVSRGARPVDAPTEVKPSAALEGVRNGSLDVNGYVDAKVHDATAHLSHLTPTQLATVQGLVRSQLLADPHLRDLVQHATGIAPPKEDE